MSSPSIQDYSTLAEDYDRTRYEGGTNARKERFRQEALVELLPARAERALDVACGTGRGVSMLARIASEAYGVDGTPDMLRIAREKVGAERGAAGFCQANAVRLPFADGAFDAVTCLNFLHLFPALEQKLAFTREIGRVLRPGGVAVVEFDSALQGLLLGVGRKYLGRDIGYDWPWTIAGCFPRDLFSIEATRGANFPGTWRWAPLALVERGGRYFPLNYLATRIFVQARRR